VCLLLEAEVFKLALTQGPFAALFVALLFWVLRENSKRENTLMSFFDKIDARTANIERRQESISERVDRIIDCMKG
jgi:hypothetical protein